jgi:hypothetical protein
MLLKGSCCATRRVNFTVSAKDRMSWQPNRMKDSLPDHAERLTIFLFEVMRVNYRMFEGIAGLDVLQTKSSIRSQ